MILVAFAGCKGDVGVVYDIHLGVQTRSDEFSDGEGLTGIKSKDGVAPISRNSS